MLVLGEIRKGTEIGYRTRNTFIYHACVDCSRERWVGFRQSNPVSLRCRKCAKKKDLNPSWKGGKLILHACVDCGKERLVRLLNGEPGNKRCASCVRSGELNHSWKGGRRETTDGYILVKLKLNNFFYPMTDKHGYVLEHRLAMAKHLERCLHPWELVHHKGIRFEGIINKQDNLIDNLQLVMDAGHKQITHFEKILRRQQSEIDELKKQVKLLKWQIKESRHAVTRPY